MPNTPTFSIIIPVLHESRIIHGLLDSLRRLTTDGPVEIIVVDGSLSRDTLQVISDETIQRYRCHAGRARQMNLGAAHASGDILIFLHADTRLPENALARIQQTLQNPQLVGGAFSLQIDSSRFLLRMTAVFSTLRSRMSRAPYGDQAIFLRKSYFDSIGGYQDLPLMEDVDLMRRIKKHKDDIIILTDSVITSDRRWNQEGLLYTALRNNLIIFLYWCGMPAEKLARFYPWQKP
ncbi:MAG: TIGR04283 family arsenosugar biosynthesis glycosyltransferase [Candidatus Thermoplasmatota archaeon]|nr:TIGR04283 family arsenosugar biosynthesis glycosyltransferase [Candidatus Thermoplasmatota archaeon]